MGINISKNTKRASGYAITLFFELTLNKKDLKILQALKSTLSVGNIYYRSKDNTYRWKVSGIDEIINVIIPHLDAYPLFTQKRVDFIVFKEIVYLIKEKQHIKDISKIVKLKACLNRGLNDKLKGEFPHYSFSSKVTQYRDNNINSDYTGDNIFLIF